MRTFSGRSTLTIWVPFAVAISLLCGILYVVVQQHYRMTANDPQYQMAEEAANAIGNGADPHSLLPSSSPVEISNTLSPYLIIYDEQEHAIVNGATLNGNVPKLPSGVLEYVNIHGEEAVTWQPQPGIRQAVVIKKAKGNHLYFIMAGRSLRKTEERIGLLSRQVALGWISSLAILIVTIFVQSLFARTTLLK